MEGSIKAWITWLKPREEYAAQNTQHRANDQSEDGLPHWKQRQMTISVQYIEMTVQTKWQWQKCKGQGILKL